jgi:hypothetical protein
MLHFNHVGTNGAGHYDSAPPSLLPTWMEYFHVNLVCEEPGAPFRYTPKSPIRLSEHPFCWSHSHWDLPHPPLL